MDIAAANAQWIQSPRQQTKGATGQVYCRTTDSVEYTVVKILRFTGVYCTECKIRNLKWSAIFPILHEFDWPCVQSECTVPKFWLAVLEKCSEIGQWSAGIFCTLLLTLKFLLCFSSVYYVSHCYDPLPPPPLPSSPQAVRPASMWWNMWRRTWRGTLRLWE